jgi:CheY-like chemotaxis protein/HPt (histidine-containing phosphotransfer) domain-containing protein
VVDTGIGIKEEDLHKLFSPFERIEEIRNRSIEGTGLGMSIVKKLLAMMDTKLEVKSVYGEGSDFSFEVRQQAAGTDEIGDFQEKYKAYLASLEKYHESFRAPEASILVVDDTTMNLTVVKGLLKKTQVQVDTAESGRETLAKAVKKKYDVLFIDHRMPEMDGLETLAALKKLEGNLSQEAPCIALTANAGSGAREEYMAAGFDDYLAKPVSGPELEKMLRTYLPPEKVMDADDETGDEPGGSEDQATTGSDLTERMKDLPGIDAGEALKNCGSAEILENVLKDFWISIEKKANDIEAFAEAEDYRNFTVAVHALKSSARLMGAMQLSAEAAYLEQCGNEENKEQIREKTPALLTAYRALREILAPLCEEEKRDDLPEIPEKEFLGALGDMKELLEAYDFDTADNIMAMLSEYRIPETHREKYEKIKELMAAVDRDALLELLQ